MEGGPSHLDLVDPKPLLNKLAGQPLPMGFKEPITAMGEKGSPLLIAPTDLEAAWRIGDVGFGVDSAHRHLHG